MSSDPPQRSRKQRFLRWVLFNGLLSLVPFVISAAITAQRNNTITLGTVTSNGELLMISAILVAGVLGELFPPSPQHTEMAMVTLVFGLILVIFGSSSYGYVVASEPAVRDNTFLGGLSLILFIGSLIVGIGCIVYSE